MRILLLIAAAALAPLAYSAPITWSGNFVPVNGSSVSGTATLVLTGDQLTVTINATGLEPGTHPQHIHGPVAGTPTDLDRDGFIETPEAIPAIGPVLIDLVPYAAGSTINWTNTYTVDPATLLPLSNKVVELHGRNVPPGAGAGTPYEVNGTGGYIPILPIASAQLTEVPEPSPLLLTGLGILALGILRRARRRRQA